MTLYTTGVKYWFAWSLSPCVEAHISVHSSIPRSTNICRVDGMNKALHLATMLCWRLDLFTKIRRREDISLLCPGDQCQKTEGEHFHCLQISNESKFGICSGSHQTCSIHSSFLVLPNVVKRNMLVQDYGENCPAVHQEADHCWYQSRMLQKWGCLLRRQGCSGGMFTSVFVSMNKVDQLFYLA